MTFTAANVWFGYIALGLFTIRRNLHAALEQRGDWSAYGWNEAQEFTGIRAADLWHRARLTQITRPVLTICLEQAALLCVSSAIVIAIEVRAFNARGSFHKMDYRRRWDRFYHS